MYRDSRKNESKKIDILIIGAGLSGLTSAFKIKQNESSLYVRILEQSDRVGGQLKKVSLGEIGAKWLTEEQGHVYRLFKALNVQMHKRNIISSQLKTYRELDEGLFSRLAKYELKRYINELQLKLESYKSVDINSRHNGYSMYHHIHNRLFFNSSRKYMMNLVLLICGLDAKTVKFEDFMSICYTCGGIRQLVELLFVEASNYSLLQFSSKELLAKLLSTIMDTEIYCECKVIEINQYHNFVEVKDSANGCHIAEAIILAVPLRCLQEIHFSPSLPSELKISLPEANERKYIITSFLIKYSQAYWRLKGFSGHFIKHEPILVGHEYRPTVYFGFIVHEQGIEPVVRSVVTQELATIFGEEMLLPQEFQQYSFELPNLVHVPMTAPWNRVILSSSSVAGTCYRGHLGGAVQSGLRAAINALFISRPQSITWRDIDELKCQNYLPKREVTWTSKVLSTWNLYNVSSYTIFICGLVAILTKVYKAHHLH